ncbi:DUF883 family protein [Pollutimonas thiosulfatoxidans]|uniref:DUF883 domain-containing protein n=1 Tax=Pollutimonas thiosulfatoxidans TaxID=2028345 RepID=A0A410G8B0_9BURK|nr:DUF883 family protein [Pollutimonas thiosulfatoxidans]MBF6618577.1 DUF883 family protein [Candidimonas sp.]NYT43694.1 DUF883 family protein [Alcaligenaceae bacterium]QAA92559.1 hypothetical protein CKA81_00905 [Pollutimonas thiosulfatoxidans]
MATKKTTQASEEEFIESVKESLDDAERRLREAAEATGDKAAELREDAMRSLRRTREALYDAQDELLERGRKAARVTDEYVHDNPWQAIGVAGLVGVLIGALMCRR